MPLAGTGTVGREEDAAIRAVDRGDVVVVERLIGDFCDGRRLADAEAGDLVDLPILFDDLKLAGGCADHHAEQRFGSAPVHVRVAHGNGGGALEGIGRAKSRFPGEVAQGAFGPQEIKVPAAADGFHAGLVIAKGRTDGGEVAGDGELGDKKNGVCQAIAAAFGGLPGHLGSTGGIRPEQTRGKGGDGQRHGWAEMARSQVDSDSGLRLKDGSAVHVGLLVSDEI